MMKPGSRAVALEPIGSTAMRVCASLLIAMCTAGAASASAQTLADVARTENDRRQTVKGSGGKTWTNQDLKPVPGAPDIREIQRQVKAAGVQLTIEADETTTGPAHFVAVDPDGNPVLFDQHL